MMSTKTLTTEEVGNDSRRRQAKTEAPEAFGGINLPASPIDTYAMV